MGSVDINYKCPHCDHRGYGGYAVDGINYPICTNGTANCLDKAISGLCSRAAVKRAALFVLLDRPANHAAPIYKVLVAMGAVSQVLSERITTYL